MATNQQFCLRWNNHQRTLISVFDSLLESGTLVDCTLAAEGQFLKAHKVVLSACSPYLGVLLSQHHEKHPILILKDIRFQELKAMLDYMYRGEVNITQEHLCTFLKAAESLQIKGLTESAGIQPEAKEYEERVTKRSYDRKGSSNAHNHNVRTRSPVTPDTVWNQKFPSQGFRSTTPPIVRDGSTSPSSRKRRKQQHPLPNCDESVSSNSGENSQESNVNDSLCVQETNVQINNTCSTSFLGLNNLKSDIVEKITCEVDGKSMENKSGNSNNKNADIFGTIAVKAEIIEDKECTGEPSYEDSVEELTVEDEEEDMIDENDMPKAGPSNSDDGQSFGMGPFHASCDNTDGVSTGQMDCQVDFLNEESYLWAGTEEDQNDPMYMSPSPLKAALSTPPLSQIPDIIAGGNKNEKFIQCSKCGRQYKLKSSLLNHQRWECGKEPQFKCTLCNYKAKQKVHLVTHMRYKHALRHELFFPKQ